jgi:hypothetical protein
MESDTVSALGEKPIAAIVQQAEESERQLVERAIASLSRSNWDVGECAARWTTRFAKGRGDEQFANLVGVSRSQVQQCRQVYEIFGDVRDLYPSLKFDHFYVARNWDDSQECLAWAEENQARVSEMVAWRRMNGGEDTEDENDHFATSEPSSCQNLAEDEATCTSDLQVDVQDVDPYVKPPSTVVSTPRDFPAAAEKPAKPVEPVENLCDELRDILAAFRSTMQLLRGEAERQAMIVELRRMADEIEGAA